MNIYLDESGDLGWNFNAPFRQGGSSRYFTIGYIVSPKVKSHLLRNLISDVYKIKGIKKGNELKGNSLSTSSKKIFAQNTVQLVQKNTEIKIGAITIRKEKISAEKRGDINILYNFMICKGIMDHIKSHTGGCSFVQDLRVKNKVIETSLIDYLNTFLIFHLNSKTKLIYNAGNSLANRGIVFADFISNIVWNKHENQELEPFQILRPIIKETHLYF